jgi:hypothetical protein
MPKSINGWTVIEKWDAARLLTIPVPNANRRLTVRRSVAPLFAALAADYHRWVRPIDKGTVDEGGWNPRQARNASAWSNHASGTAVDINWSEEGAQNSTVGRLFFANPKNLAGIVRILKIYSPVIFWGGNWRNFKDYMHFEIAPGVTQAQVTALITKLGIDEQGVRHNNWAGKPLKQPLDPAK